MALMSDDSPPVISPPIISPLVIETVTDLGAAPSIAFLAAATFPLACPAHSSREDIAAHIAESLSPQRFSAWITGDDADVIVARDGAGGPLIGYALVLHGRPADPDVRAAVPGDAVSEVSKMYVLPGHHGTSNHGTQPHSQRRAATPSHQLMEAAVAAARARASSTVWLGVNQLNERALRYYRKMGFTRAGTKSFDMNGTVEHDFVMARALSPSTPSPTRSGT